MREALTILRELGSPDHVCEALEAFAAVVRVREGAEAAARICGASERLREDIHSTMMSARRPWYDAAVAAARAESGDGAFDLAWNEGRAMSAEEAVAYALRVGSR